MNVIMIVTQDGMFKLLGRCAAFQVKNGEFGGSIPMKLMATMVFLSEYGTCHK